MSKSQAYLFIYDQSSWIPGQQKSYHAGISVYGKEYCYTEEGVKTIEHTTSFNGAPLVRPFTLGMTDVAEINFLAKVEQFKSGEFEKSKYEKKTHNSCHFARELIKFLLEMERLEPELEEYLNQSWAESGIGCILS